MCTRMSESPVPTRSLGFNDAISGNCLEPSVSHTHTDQAGLKGHGLRTDEDITEGQLILEYVGEIIDEDEYQRRLRAYAVRSVG